MIYAKFLINPGMVPGVIPFLSNRSIKISVSGFKLSPVIFSEIYSIEHLLSLGLGQK